MKTISDKVLARKVSKIAEDFEREVEVVRKRLEAGEKLLFVPRGDRWKFANGDRVNRSVVDRLRAMKFVRSDVEGNGTLVYTTPDQEAERQRERDAKRAKKEEKRSSNERDRISVWVNALKLAAKDGTIEPVLRRILSRTNVILLTDDLTDDEKAGRL